MKLRPSKVVLPAHECGDKQDATPENSRRMACIFSYHIQAGEETMLFLLKINALKS